MPDHSLTTTTILLLVSDALVRSVLKDTLEDPGYTVRRPGQCMTGHDAATYLRTKSNGLRVLMVGGLLDDSRLQYRASLEGFDVFPKPYSPAELLQKVKDVLNKPRGGTKESP